MDICNGCELCSIEKGEHRLNYGEMSDDLFHNTLSYLIYWWKETRQAHKDFKIIILGQKHMGIAFFWDSIS